MAKRQSKNNKKLIYFFYGKQAEIGIQKTSHEYNYPEIKIKYPSHPKFGDANN